MTKLFKQAEFHVTVTRIVDGDTVDVDIDLGFSTVLKKQRVRLMGIDTPESRTRDLVEKIFGKASKKHLTKLLSEGDVTLVSHDKGKFGRILGEMFVAPLDEDGEPIPTDEPRVSVNQQMIDEHHAVEYTGESKDTTTERHLEHRKLLLEKGTVTQEQIDEVL
jgi:micrococcal nuclease|tara:strand:+ start:258 stop:746 length:489 start_codon:yes stop_codon:yes gene_type:complete